MGDWQEAVVVWRWYQLYSQLQGRRHQRTSTRWGLPSTTSSSGGRRLAQVSGAVSAVALWRLGGGRVGPPQLCVSPAGALLLLKHLRGIKGVEYGGPNGWAPGRI